MLVGSVAGVDHARADAAGKKLRRTGRAVAQDNDIGALKWRVGETQVKRKLGLRRVPGSSLRLTAREAEAGLRRAIQETAAHPPLHERLDFAEAAQRYIAHAESVLMRKPTTIADYGSMLRRHLGPFFGGRSLASIRVTMAGSTDTGQRWGT